MDSQKLSDVVLFTSIRKIKNLTAESLTLLEARHQYIKDLENVLIKAGIGEYEHSNADYQRDRKRILDYSGNIVRELEEIKKLIN